MDSQASHHVGTFWNSAKIKREVEEKRVILVPPTSDEIRPEKFIPPSEKELTDLKDAAYELHLGPEAYVSGARDKTRLKPGDVVAIAPGQMALLLTEERVEIPLSVVAFISLKTSVKVPGLINVSGFHVDPGFHGRLVFTVYNAGSEPCAFMRGQKMFLMWFADLNDAEKKHDGKRQDQNSIPADDISRLLTAGASPAELDKRIRRLEIVAPVYAALLLVILGAVATIVINRGRTDPSGSEVSTERISLPIAQSREDIADPDVQGQ